MMMVLNRNPKPQIRESANPSPSTARKRSGFLQFTDAATFRFKLNGERKNAGGRYEIVRGTQDFAISLFSRSEDKAESFLDAAVEK